MACPIILTVDDDAAVSQAISRDLRSRYADRYRIVRATSGAEALAKLDELAKRDLQVALIVSDHADVAIKAINDIGLDHYLMKPWTPPEERLYPVLDDLLDEWDHANRRFDGVRVIATFATTPATFPPSTRTQRNSTRCGPT